MRAEKLLKLLQEHKVIFVIIGATAFPVHGYSRATLDIDIFIKPDHKNARKTWVALRSFGYNLMDLTPDDLLKKKTLIRQYTVETDIHPFVKGITFKTIWGNRIKAKFGKTNAYFASLKDLIKMKKAAGRPQDLSDLKFLKKINRIKKK